MSSYNHAKIEKKWQKRWAQDGVYKTANSRRERENYYLLVEFPYPSGNLHVGHWYAFAVPDIFARFQRMSGKNVMFPIGFDAFGLPAENAAIKNKLNPRAWTEKNIAHMTKQIESMGTSFDWSRSFATIDPAYYRWTQWLFLKFFQAGLAYQKETAVNWCPKDKTVLANEQVVGGLCERCDTPVEQRQMLQWNLKITDYADRLVDDLDSLDWPDEIKDSQRNWIGRSEGAEIDFYLEFDDQEISDRVGPDGKKAHITIFTTRPDTIYGATYIVLAPEHPWIKRALQHTTVFKNNDEVQLYSNQANRKSELERQESREKTGVKLNGVMAVNPASGEKIPLFVADYVLGHYGTGAIMAVPAHDKRDFEFAIKYDVSAKQVVAPVSRVTKGGDAVRTGESFTDRDAVTCIVKHWKNDEYLCIQWKRFETIRTFISGGIEQGEDAVVAGIREIQEESGYQNPVFVRSVGQTQFIEFYHQQKKKNVRAKMRYLYFELKNGEQTPLSFEESAKHEILWKTREEVAAFIGARDMMRVWDQFLNGDEPYEGEGRLIDSGELSGLSMREGVSRAAAHFGRPKKTYKLRDWVVSRQRYWGVPIPIIHCEVCGPVAVAESKLPVKLPVVKDYLPTGDGRSPLAKVKSFVETTCPQCKTKAKRETDTLDTFVDSSWYFLRYTDPNNEKAFASRSAQEAWMPVDLYSGGAEHTTMHVLYSRFWQKALFDLGLVADSEPYTRRMNRGLILGPDGQKMSKSRGNVIDPDEVVARMGADTVRMYLAFIGPYNEAGSYPWNPNGVVGVQRFLERLWRLQDVVRKKDVEQLQPMLHRTIKKVGGDVAAFKFNTAIAQLMMFLNAAEKEKQIGAAQWRSLLRILAPFAPHMAEELWQKTGENKSVHRATWPSYDDAYLVEREITLAIQVDGKTRGILTVSADGTDDFLEQAAKKIVEKRLDGRVVVKTVIVPGRLVNFVLKK